MDCCVRGLSNRVAERFVCVSIRVCAEYGGAGADFSGLVRKTGPVVAGPDGPCSCVDGPTKRRSVDLPHHRSV